MKVSRKRKNLVVLDGTVGKVSRIPRMFVSREEVRRKQAGSATVVIICVLAAMLGLLGAVSIYIEIASPEIDNQLPGVSADAAKYDDEDALTVAVIRDDDDGVPEKLMLMRFEPSEERIYIAGVPLDVEVGGETLLEHYGSGGIKAVKSALETLVDCENVYTLRFNYVQTRKLINYFSGVKLTLNYDISYQSPDGNRNVNVVAGTRLYTGWEIARLLDYPNWEGGEEEHLYMYTYVLSEFFEQNFKNLDEKSLQKFFTHICTYSENDISTSAFHSANAGLIYLSELESGNRTMLVEPETTASDNGNRIYDEDQLLLLRAVFGNRDPDSSE